ncbi:MAG: hypothetical protein RL154_764 [Pseudomonadota bacterium]|jgi:serine phosphatase RsbU (regulator of sigma subunit)
MFEAVFSIVDKNKISDLSVKLKLRVLILISLCVALLVLSIGLYGMFRVNGSMVTTYKQSVMPLDRLRTAKQSIEVDVIELLTLLKEGKLSSEKQQTIDEMYQDVSKKLEDAKKSFAENWQAYTSGTLTPEEQEVVAQLEPEIKRALDSIDNAKLVVKNKDFPGLLEYVGSEMPFFLHNIPPKLDLLMQLQVVKTLSFYEDSQVAFRNALVLVVIFSTLGVIGLFWVTKRIDNDLVGAVETLYLNADDLARNKLDMPFNWTRKDELGKLGRRIEHTREELNKLIGQLTKSNAEVTKTHEAIRNSINYARRIQMSFLPEESRFKSCDALTINSEENKFGGLDLVKDYFIVWNPKDIIGGDCYWFEHTDEGFFMAIIDCTGHGVPGALMTFVSLSALSRALTHCGTASDPAALLSYINNKIKNDLGQHTEGGTSNDGMDGAFIFIDKERKVLKYAGANIPLMMLKPNSDEIDELRPDKLSAGYIHVPTNAEYSNQEIALEPGMRFYITTDGIVDQVGGDRSLCFGKKRLKKLILQTKDMGMQEQKDRIMQDFYTYRGSEIQRDDNTIIGFEI